MDYLYKIYVSWFILQLHVLKDQFKALFLVYCLVPRSSGQVTHIFPI